MKRIARLVVHVEEALSCAEQGDEDHLRLSLLLWDSAAELLLYRESTYKVSFQAFDWRTLDSLRREEARGKVLPPPLAEWKEELEKRALSKTRRNKIEREFGAKVEFLEADGLLPAPYARVLHKLHAYRNEAYHQDHVRIETLASSVRIYGFVVCKMMEIFPLHVLGSSSNEGVPDAIARYVEIPPMSFDIQARIGVELLRRSGFEEPSDLSDLLADHVVSRLDEIEDQLQWTSEFVAQMHQDAAWDAVTMLHAVQLDDDAFIRLPSAEAIRRHAVPVSLSDFQTWRSGAEELRAIASQVDVFSAFADLEDAFEPIESLILDAASAIDGEIQHQVDLARGK